MAEYPTMLKSEFADKCKVSIGQVRRWCNVDYLEELKKMGYRKTQHMLTPKQVGFLSQNIVEFSNS